MSAERRRRRSGYAITVKGMFETEARRRTEAKIGSDKLLSALLRMLESQSRRAA